MTTSTLEQRREINEAGSAPVRVEDPVTRELFVILKADVYDKLVQNLEPEKVDPSFFEYSDFIPRPS